MFRQPSADRAQEPVPAGSSPSMLRLVAGYCFSILMPWLAGDFTAHTSSLRGTRLALNFSVVAAAATFFGLGPALVAIVVSAIAFEHYAPSTMGPPLTVADTLIRAAVVILTGTMIALIIKQQHDGQKRLQKALDRLEEQREALSQAQRASGGAAWMYDSNARRIRWYDRETGLFGRPMPIDELLGLGTPNGRILPEDREMIQKAIDHTSRTGEPLRIEYRISRRSGEERWLEARGNPLHANPKIWYGATVDITDRKLAEIALVRNEKLAVAGRLAASIAHEINNPLEAVINLCYLARHTTGDEETRGYLQTAEEELGRIAQITSQTLRFHRQQTSPVEIDLGEIIASILLFFERRLQAATIVVDFDRRTITPIVLYAGEIRQVMANLIANAMDAMPSGGQLRIRLRTSRDWRDNSPAVRVTIADTGHGMSEDTRRRIYEPFYTTKGDVGTGLGLWVTAGIVEKHRGRLGVRSRLQPVGGGSVFTILLPYNNRIEQAATTPPA